MNSAPNPKPMIATLTFLLTDVAPKMKIRWWAEPTLRLTLQPPEANQAHIVHLRGFAEKDAAVFDDGGTDQLDVGAELFDVIAKPVDGVKGAAGVDRFVDAVGIERKRVAGMDFHFALLVTQRVGDTQRQTSSGFAGFLDRAVGSPHERRH